jgi:hypothetical protein
VQIPDSVASLRSRSRVLYRRASMNGSAQPLESVLLAAVSMVNNNRNRRNQPPTGEGKHQSRYLGEPRKLEKRSEVVQAQRHHPELNLGDADEEAASREGDQLNPHRPKAGR